MTGQPVEQLRIAIVGAGAIGSYYAALLARAGHDVRLYARGPHLERIRAAGLSVRTSNENFTVPVVATDRAADLDGAAYALLSVKSYSLAEVAPVLAPLANDGAAIVPLLNGVDVAERIGTLGVRPSAVLGGSTTMSVVRPEPGVVERRSPFQRAVIGELDGEISNRVTLVARVLDKAGVETRVSGDIRHDLWRKFAFLVPLAAACSLRRAPIGDVLSTAEGHDLVRQALHEIIEVGRAVGVNWSDTDESQSLMAIEALSPAMKPSFLLDVERGGRTEVDLLSGTVSRLGRQHGVPTPVHDRVRDAFAHTSV